MFRSIKKRPLYSQVKHLDNDEERSKVFARMVKENPSPITYFTQKRWYQRLPELAWLLLSNEAYYRKEHNRAALYALAEPHLKDGKARDINIDARVKGVLAGTHEHFNTADKNDAKAVSTVADVVSKPLDISKILKDKEWYRWLVRTATAAAAAIALFMTAYPAKKEEPLIVEVEKEVPADCSSIESALGECVNALSKKKGCQDPGIIYRYKEIKVPDEEALNGLKAKLAELEPLRQDAEKWKNFKHTLMEKVDHLFFTVTPEEDKKYFSETIRPWFELGVEADDKNMIKLIIFMGGELLRQERDENNCIATLGKFKDTSEFGRYWENGMVTYAGGYAGPFNSWNLRCKNGRALWDYYTALYNSLAKGTKK